MAFPVIGLGLTMFGKIATGLASIAMDILKWLVKNPSRLAALVLALYSWHLHSSRGEIIAAHAQQVAALQVDNARLSGALATTRASAEAARAANESQTQAIAELQGELARSFQLTAAAKKQAETALAELRSMRQSIAQAARVEAGKREAIYENDANARAWRDTAVPGSIAMLLQQAAATGPPP